MTEILEAIHKMLFFNQRAGRKLWAEKSYEVQEQDIKDRERDLISIKWYIDKYRWHDLRKNPEDLPTEDTMVTICYEMFGGKKKYESAMRSFCANDGYQWTNTLCYFSNVIAWRYIEPFEEVE